MTCEGWPLLEETNIPSYVQIYDIVFQMIQTGELWEGDLLPGENLLAAHWNVSRTTVRTAVRKLEEDGFLYKAQGKRTMVANRINRLDNGLQWMFNPCLKNCISPVTSVQVSWNLQQCGKYVADKLGYSVESSVMASIDAVYYAGDLRVASSVLMVHSSLLERWDIQLQNEAQLSELVTTGIYARASRSGIELTAMNPAEEDELPGGGPVVVMEEVLVGGKDEPLAYLKHWLNANWYRFAVDRKPLQLC